jgi:hypothetical protein
MLHLVGFFNELYYNARIHEHQVHNKDVFYYNAFSDLPSSRMLRSVDWYLISDVSA